MTIVMDEALNAKKALTAEELKDFYITAFSLGLVDVVRILLEHGPPDSGTLQYIVIHGQYQIGAMVCRRYPDLTIEYAHALVTGHGCPVMLSTALDMMKNHENLHGLYAAALTAGNAELAGIVQNQIQTTFDSTNDAFSCAMATEND